MAVAYARKLLGVTGMQVEHRYDELTRINVELVASPEYNPHHLMYEEWDDIFPGDAIVHCQYCGQWAARKTACAHCGGSVD